jgi:hydrogenase nickel incorporation protein HypB
MVETALARLAPADDSVLMIENVGNLVCPAGFDLGEAHKVAVLSVTEGEDKPLKYPDMFHAASLLLLNKIDLLPHLRFDVERCLANAKQVNPAIEVLQLSAATDQGLADWLAWIERGATAARQQRVSQVAALPHPAQDVASLQRRVAELEAQVARLQPR